MPCSRNRDYFRAFRTVAFGVAMVGALSCSAKSEQLGGETNWLTLCERDADCPETPCRCGVCTNECNEASDCGGFSGATCAGGDSSATEQQCGQPAPVGLCLPECSRDSDCERDQRCAAGACILQSGSTATPDASGSMEPEPMQRSVPNPTGDCIAEDNGGRIEHGPNPTDVYLLDCELDLNREYYRVFVQADDTAYMIPRPDNHPAFIWACINETDPIHATLQEYSLCQSEALNSSQVEKVNAMLPSDALTIAHYLHERLVFFASEGGVYPYAQAQDILDLCKSDEGFRNGPMQERCDFELESEHGPRASIGWIHTGEQAEVLASALNQLYGVTDDKLCDRLSDDASAALTRALYAEPHTCTAPEDCVQVGHNSDCHDACGAVISVDNQDAFGEARELINGEQCASREAAGCGGFIAPPCAPPGSVDCVDGMCTGG